MAIRYEKALRFRPVAHQSDANEVAHQLIRKLYQQYQEHYGTVLCNDVREKAERRCPEVVGNAAKWAAQILLDEFGIEGPEKEPTRGTAEKAP